MNRMDILNDLKRLIENSAEVEYDNNEECWVAYSKIHYCGVYFATWWVADDAHTPNLRGLVEVYDNNNEKHPNRTYENIAEWLDANLCDWSEIEKAHEDDMRPYDYWDEHGFRNAQDYYNYRYG